MNLPPHLSRTLSNRGRHFPPRADSSLSLPFRGHRAPLPVYQHAALYFASRRDFYRPWPNPSLERTSGKLRLPVPSRLRRSAAAQLERWASRVIRLSLLVSGMLCSATIAYATSFDLKLVDPTSGRSLPLVVYPPSEGTCASPCNVVLFGTGYQVSAREYSFLGNALANAGYFVAVIQYDLPNDHPMPSTGNIVIDRTFFWRRGVSSLDNLLRQLPYRFPTFDWHSVVLSGHSQGGDIAAMFASEHPSRVKALFTLDNRRVPLPQDATFPILTLRSSDQRPDPGVLPTTNSKACILNTPNTLHDEMTDKGDLPSKATLSNAVLRFLKEQQCLL